MRLPRTSRCVTSHDARRGAHARRQTDLRFQSSAVLALQEASEGELLGRHLAVAVADTLVTSLPRLTLRRHEFGRHPRQACEWSSTLP